MEESKETIDLDELTTELLGSSVKDHGSFVPHDAPEAEVRPSAANTTTELCAIPDTQTNGSDEIFEMYCETCNRDGKHTPAYGFCTSCMAYFCSTCLNYHGKFLPDHRYLEGDAMPLDVCTEKCSVHDTEIIKFYCATCDKFVCSVCKRRDHKELCAMQYLPDIVKDLERGEEFKQLILRWNCIAKQLFDTEKAIDAHHEHISRLSSEVKIAIKKEKATLFSRFDQEADEIEKNIRSVKQVDDIRVSNVKEKIQPLSVGIGMLLNSIKQMPTSPKSQKYKLFIELKQLGNRLKQVVNVVENLTEYDAFKGKLEEHANDLTKRVREFGSLMMDKNVKMKATGEKDQRKVARFVGDINVGSARDNADCKIVDCCVLSEQFLIVCDKSNSSVKLIDTKGRGVIYVRHINTDPEAVAKITDSKFAMVHPYGNDEDRSIIQFLTMTESRSLDFQTHFILTEMYCVNIACVNGDRLISSMWANHEGKVQILSMSGQVIANFEYNKKGSKLFNCPDYLALDAEGKRLYVTDWYRDSVTELDLVNRVTRELAHRFWHPEGITTDKKGFVYVCETGTSRVHVFHPDDDDSTPQVLLDKHTVDWQPLWIRFSFTDNKLYVGQKGLNCIKVYEIANSDFSKKK